MKMGQSTVVRIGKKGGLRISKRGYVHQGRDKFKKDDFWKYLMWETIYNFYKNKTTPSIDVLHIKLKGLSTERHYALFYGRTTLYHLLKRLDFKYQKADNHKVLMEAPSIVAWRWEYLRQIEKHPSEGYLIVYLDETWFDSHDVSGFFRMVQ